ncbi:histidine kinase [Luteolibacter sp. Populi]|uniref:histidine kinase n=1 Tax=Luteolibacter sp. Populi TaxID=3230487 RepID=UPI003467C59A
MVPAVLRADETGWDYRLAKQFSPRLSGAEKELGDIQTELPRLPTVPVADQGGTGGFAALHPKAEPSNDGEYSVSLNFASPGLVDLVVLIPARRYGVGGLEPQFGLPDAFTMDLLDENGKVVSRIADEKGLWADPVRAGHPFLFPVTPGIRGAGVKISAARLRLDSDVSDSFVHAWAEAFVFEGERNLAHGAAVTSSGGSPPPAPWQWSNAFLVDGQTTLGLPEIPAGHHENVGWMSDARAKSTDAVWLELDLGEVREFDALRLFPAKRPTSDLPSGFGFPSRFTVSVFDRPSGTPGVEPVVVKEFETGNPGHNPALFAMGNCQGRYVKIEITRLWKVYENFPAFAAFSEIEVLAGEKNQAEGARVRSEPGMGTVIGSGSQYWSAPSLTDGFGPDGKLVSPRGWLLALGRRLELEQRQDQLRREAAAIVGGWRRAGWWAIAVCGGLGTVLVIALPIRYQLREKRQLVKVRERIAGDLHDEVGSNLGSIQMFADLAERHGAASNELKRIQRIAAETVSAVRDIVWLLRPQGDHRIATVEHMRETCSIMLESHEWKFTANEAAWQCEMSDDANRHLFLYLRESLHNILRHASAKHVGLHVECDAKELRLSIKDDGCGIAAERMERPATLRALRKRAEALDASFNVDSTPGQGTRLELAIPLHAKRRPRPREAS